MVLFLLLFGGIGAVVGLVGLAFLKAYWTMARSDPTPVREVTASTGEVELSGTARAIGEPIRSPFEDEDCVLCTWSMQRPSGGNQGSNWHDVASGQEYDPFILDDGTGEIVVDPNGAEWALEEERVQTTDTDTPPSQPVRKFLAEKDMEPLAEAESPPHRKRKFRESRLDDGEEVYVYGPVKAGPHESAGHGTVQPYIGTDSTDAQHIDGRATMVFEKDIFPFVGDSDKTLKVGGAGEGTVFAVADTGESAAQRRYLKRGSIALVFGLLFLGAAVAVSLFGGSADGGAGAASMVAPLLV